MSSAEADQYFADLEAIMGGAPKHLRGKAALAAVLVDIAVAPDLQTLPWYPITERMKAVIPRGSDKTGANLFYWSDIVRDAYHESALPGPDKPEYFILGSVCFSGIRDICLDVDPERPAAAIHQDVRIRLHDLAIEHDLMEQYEDPQGPQFSDCAAIILLMIFQIDAL